jgi:hypothetical protein
MEQNIYHDSFVRRIFFLSLKANIIQKHLMAETHE